MLFLWLLLLAPLALAFEYLLHLSPLWVFAAALLAIVPLAEWIRRATENLAAVAGPAIGGLLNVTFGNVAELTLAVFVLLAGRTDVVKAQITGSIVGNSLLGLGLAILAGSWGRTRQRFNRERVSQLSSLMILAVIALLVPALFDYTERGVYRVPHPGVQDERFSLGAAVVLILVYIANLVFTLVTHRDVFAVDDDAGDAKGGKQGAQGGSGGGPDAGSGGAAEEPAEEPAEESAGKEGKEEPWPLWKSLSILVGATAAIAWEAELVSGALEASASTLGLTTFFLGITVLAIVGNAAEYLAAVYFARSNRMSLVMGITVGSSIQVALLVAPVLVLVSYFIGHPMNLVFANPIELVAVASAALVVRSIAQDGESTWFEGVLLVAVYLLLALAFFYVAP